MIIHVESPLCLIAVIFFSLLLLQVLAFVDLADGIDVLAHWLVLRVVPWDVGVVVVLVHCPGGEHGGFRERHDIKIITKVIGRSKIKCAGIKGSLLAFADLLQALPKQVAVIRVLNQRVSGCLAVRVHLEHKVFHALDVQVQAKWLLQEVYLGSADGNARSLKLLQLLFEPTCAFLVEVAQDVLFHRFILLFIVFVVDLIEVVGMLVVVAWKQEAVGHLGVAFPGLADMRTSTTLKMAHPVHFYLALQMFWIAAVVAVILLSRHALEGFLQS